MIKSTVLFTAVCLSLGVTATWFWMSRGAPTIHADCTRNGSPCVDGDVNGDGALDITDPVYLLNHLFLGGSAPLPCVCTDPPCPPGGPLPATGQTLCYDLAGEKTNCDNEASPGQDGAHQAGCPTVDRFVVDNENGTVTDTCTGLTWLQATADTNWDSRVDASDALTWEAALRYCDDLEYAEHRDWRLPNVRELASIADYGRCPAFDPNVFSMALPGDGWLVFYWSSTSPVNVAERGKAWNVYFWNGLVRGDPKTFRGYVLAVRG